MEFGKTLKILILSGALTASSAQATGGNGGGGGNEIVAQFISTAYALMVKVHFSPDHQAALLEGLRPDSITSVAVLKDENGVPVPDQKNLIAYSYRSPNGPVIQLKDTPADGQGESWEARWKAKLPLAHMVIHELLRASGRVEGEGRDKHSIDEGYQISIGVYHLETPHALDVKPRALRRAEIMRDRGLKYCEELNTKNEILLCKAVIDAQTQIALMVISGDREHEEILMERLRHSSDVMCRTYTGPNWRWAEGAKIGSACQLADKYKHEQFSAILTGDLADFDILQQSAAEYGNDFAVLLPSNTMRYSTACLKTYKIYLDKFNDLLLELSKGVN